MSRAKHRHTEKGSLELIEEAIHLLRAAPMSALAGYYLGALPFVLGLLYFWADMSRSPFAYQHLAGAALGLAGLFLWMKFWQAIAVCQIRATLAGASAPQLSFKFCAWILMTQTTLQPTGLFLLPLALVPTLPFPWVYAFYQNATILAGRAPGEFRELIKKSGRHAALWPKQNHILLGILFGFALFVFLNWASVCLLLPRLVKMLFDVESVFTRGGGSTVNSTFFAAVFGLTYLCVDPVVKTIYTLRCFYGEAVESGEDLKAELRGFASTTKGALACLLVLGALAGPLLETAKAVETPQLDAATPLKRAVTPASISGPELDRAIQKVMQQRKYTWRMPREKITEPKEAQEGIVGRFLRRVANLLKEWLNAFGHWLDGWLRRLFFRNRPNQPGSSGYNWILAQELLLGALGVAVLAGLGFFLYRVWRDRQPAVAAIAGEPIQPTPDLTDETLGADQLPEDSWTRLGRELLARGELRLALRAFYLASLAHLAGRNLIGLAKFKSNRDYENELRRRGHVVPDLLSLFAENVSVFDRAWYGLHEVTADAISRFEANVESIRRTA